MGDYLRSDFEDSGNRFIQKVPKELFSQNPDFLSSGLPIQYNKIQGLLSQIGQIISPGKNLEIKSFELKKTSNHPEAYWYFHVSIKLGQYSSGDLNFSTSGKAGSFLAYLRKPFHIELNQNYHGEKRNPSSTDCSHLISKITSEAKIYVQEISINEINANSADFFPATSPIDFSTPASAALKISEFIFPEIPYEVENVGLRSTSEYSSSKSGWYYYVALRPKLNIVSESNVELPDCPSLILLYFDTKGNFGDFFIQEKQEFDLSL